MAIDLGLLRTTSRARFPTFPRSGFYGVEILQCLKGQPYDELAVALISLFNPDWIRVTDGAITTDGDLGTRVTVLADPQTGKIESIHFSGRGGLPEGLQHGQALIQECERRGIDLGVQT